MQSGGGSNLGTKNITANGTYQAQDDNLDGYSAVTVAVTPTLQNKTITQNGTYTADSGYDGLGTVAVNVSGGSGDEIFEYILQNITYLDGQFVAGDYTYKIGWVFADMDGIDVTGEYIYHATPSSATRIAVYSGDGSTTRSQTSYKHYSYPPYPHNKRLNFFNVLFKNGVAKAAWLNMLVAYTNTYLNIIQQPRYAQYYYDGAYHYVLEDGQPATEAEYKAAYYSSTPHTDVILHSCVYREYYVGSCSGSFSYDLSTITNVNNVMKYGNFPITFTSYSYEIDYTEYRAYPTTDLSDWSAWGADWETLHTTYGSEAYNIVQTYPPRPVATGTGVHASQSYTNRGGTLYFFPASYFGEIAKDEWVEVYNSVAQSILNTISPNDEAVMPPITPEYVQST